jgi:hypothetical protein
VKLDPLLGFVQLEQTKILREILPPCANSVFTIQPDNKRERHCTANQVIEHARGYPQPMREDR